VSLNLRSEKVAPPCSEELGGARDWPRLDAVADDKCPAQGFIGLWSVVNVVAVVIQSH